MKNKLPVLLMTSIALLFPGSLFSGFIIVSDNYSSFSSTNNEKIDNLEMKASIEEDKSLTEYTDSPVLVKKTAVITRLDKASSWVLDYKNRVFKEEAITPLSTPKSLNDKNLKKFNVSFKKIGVNEKVGDWDCDHYALFVKDKILFEIWASRFSSLGLPESDIKVFKNFYGKFLDKGLAPFLKSNPHYKEILNDRMIIKTVSHYKEGKEKEVMLVKQVAHQDFSPDLFEIPEGFKKSKY